MICPQAIFESAMICIDINEQFIQKRKSSLSPRPNAMQQKQCEYSPKQLKPNKKKMKWLHAVCGVIHGSAAPRSQLDLKRLYLSPFKN